MAGRADKTPEDLLLNALDFRGGGGGDHFHSWLSAQFRCRTQLAEGLVEYRRGEYARVAETLAGAQTSDHPRARGPALMLHAMIHFRLGKRDDAGKLLTEAETLLGKLLQPNPHYSTAGWSDELICQMLHREARQLLDAGTAP